MPGVPSSRGCDACRKQKKKCDQGKPACSRCTRLGISCVGGGKQRFKFKAQMVQLNGLVSIDIEDERSSGTGTVTSSSSSSNSITPPNGALIRLPGNSTTMAVNAFIARLEVPDIRYDLTCFGEFLRYIPSRLGHNEALDASADALATTFSYTVQGAPSERRVAALRKYGIALNKLRICLGDPKKAKTANTMCAIYLVLVCQGWLGGDDSAPSHGEGLAYLLRATASENWESGFETEMIITFCVPVVVESISNPKIKLDKWFWDILERFRKLHPVSSDAGSQAKEKGNSFPSMSLHNLGMIPSFINEPENHRMEIMCFYHRMRIDTTKLSRALNAMKFPPGYNPAFRELQMHRVGNAAYSILLSLTILLGQVLQAFYPEDLDLIAELAFYCTEIINLADVATAWRPLGASYMPMCLSIAWAGNDEPVMRSQIGAILEDYQADYPTTDWKQVAEWWAWKFRDFRVKLAPPDSRLFALATSASKNTPSRPSECCVL